MNNMFRILFVLTVFLYSLSSCDDYVEKGIEGRWQLLEVKSVDGSVSKVDTIYYSFKKDVFQYLKLLTPTENFMCFGMYENTADNLSIKVSKDTFEPWDCFTCFDWDSYERVFTIKYHSSSKLVLDWEGEEYTFRKF